MKFLRHLSPLLVALLVVTGCSSSAAPTPAASGGSSQTGAVPAACQGKSGSASNEIHIYSSLPMQGTNAGPSTALQQAMADLLDGVTVGKYTIKYIPLDDSSTAQSGNWDGSVEQGNAAKAVNDPDAMLYLGTANSGASKVSIPITNAACLTQIAPDNTYPGLTKAVPNVTTPGEPDIYYPAGVRNYFRTTPTDDRQGAGAATWAKELGATKIYALDNLTIYGIGLANAFAETAKSLGLQIVSPNGTAEGYDVNATDYLALAQKIKASGADMIEIATSTGSNTAKLWKDLRSVLPDIKILTHNGVFEESFATGTGQAGVGTYLTFNELAPAQLTGSAAAWVQAFTAKHGQPAATTIYGAVAAQIALDAIKRAGVKDRWAILQAVAATKNLDTVEGSFSFDQNGDTTLYQTSAYQLGTTWPPTFVKIIPSN